MMGGIASRKQGVKFVYFCNKKMRLIGIEPTHAAPEATALSTELQTHLCHDTPFYWKLQGFYFAEFDEGHCFLDVILIK